MTWIVWNCEDQINCLQMCQYGPNWRQVVFLHRRKSFKLLIITCDWVRIH